MVDQKEKKICTGCTACASICPQNSIAMETDKQGFLYPKINYNTCIRCGLCDDVCEKKLVKLKEKIPNAYGVIANNDDIRRESSSGGVFTLFAESILNEGGLVIGVALTDDCRVAKHIIVENKEDLRLLRGAKYVQSELGDIYRKTRYYLNMGRVVLFSGTPCQISGLKAFLNKDYKRLICVDFICHGVPAPYVWQRYCTELENKHGGRIISAQFRHKRYSWERFCLFTSDNNGKQLFKSKKEDPYLRLFLADYMLRPSCYDCAHKGISREADITIADFWKVSEVAPELFDRKGTSLVLIHDLQGENEFKKILNKIKYRQVDVVEAIKRNTSAIDSCSIPNDYNDFWNDYDRMSVEELANRYAPITLKTRIKTIVAQSRLYRKIRGGTIDGLLLIISE